MLEVINTFLIGLVQIVSCTVIVQELLEKKIKFNIKNIIILIMMTFAMFLMLKFNFGIYKPVTFLIILILGYKIIFELKTSESIITNFISMLINVLSEIIIALLIILLKVPQNIMDKYLTNSVISNILSLVFIFIIVNLFKDKLIKFKKVLLKEKITYILYFVIAIGITLLLSKNVGNWKNNIDFIINTIIIVIFLIIIFSLFIEKYKMYKKTEEFNNMYKQAESVKTLLNRYKKYNHENKNQLLVIREIANGNKKIIKYVDSILEENIGHEDKWISELSYISDPGISGFLSVKINRMIDNNINVTLTISPKVKQFKFEKLDSNLYKKICNVIGVYLDNAFESSINTRKKEVTIEILMDKLTLILIISNSFKGEIELDKIDEEGYTTKGKNHGVGLSLVKEIIDSSEKLEQNRKIIKDYFFQYLYIKK